MPVTEQVGFIPTGQASRLAPPSPRSIMITGGIESGVFRLLVGGLPGQAVRVQRSSSLTGGWGEWQTITLGEAPPQLTDEGAAGADQIFYRAVNPPNRKVLCPNEPFANHANEIPVLHPGLPAGFPPQID